MTSTATAWLKRAFRALDQGRSPLRTTRDHVLFPYAMAFARSIVNGSSGQSLDQSAESSTVGNLYGPASVFDSPQRPIADRGTGVELHRFGPGPSSLQRPRRPRLPLVARPRSRRRQPRAEPAALLRETYGKQTAAEDVFAYVAAVAAHPAFTARFQSDLATPGLRVPLTAAQRPSPPPPIWDARSSGCTPSENDLSTQGTAGRPGRRGCRPASRRASQKPAQSRRRRTPCRTRWAMTPPNAGS